MRCRTEGRAADAAADAAIGWVSAAAYIVAAVAGEVASGSRSGPLYQQHFLEERVRQATWLQDRLALSDERQEPCISVRL